MPSGPEVVHDLLSCSMLVTNAGQDNMPGVVLSITCWPTVSSLLFTFSSFLIVGHTISGCGGLSLSDIHSHRMRHGRSDLACHSYKSFNANCKLDPKWSIIARCGLSSVSFALACKLFTNWTYFLGILSYWL